jgi:hypothetical protein
VRDSTSAHRPTLAAVVRDSTNVKHCIFPLLSPLQTH